ncbi:MAG: YihY/virulence factor BrkB family protein [Cyanobacteria bacterium Co-bin13]|nr:YihY/virulence factor BrkB family protein [Cyanobacteria bacterium Co-bin13]
MRLSLARLFNLATLRDVVHHTWKYRLPGLTAGIAYPTLLGLLLGSLALLLATGLMQPSWRSGLSSPLSQVLPVAPLTDLGTWTDGIPPGQRRQWLILTGLLAWWAGTGALLGLLKTFDLIHQIPLGQRRSRWRSRLMAMALAWGLGLMAGITLHLAYAGSSSIHLAEQSGASFDLWVATLRRLLYWLLAWGVMTATFAALYCLGPSRWLPGTPLFPGALVAASVWLGALALWQRSSGPLQGYQATFGTLGLLILLMVWVYGSLLAVLVGCQVNISVGRQRALRPPSQVRRNVMPPSFDSFTIRRRDDRFP